LVEALGLATTERNPMNKLTLPVLALGLAAALGAHAARTDLYGDPTAISEASRTIEITPDTTHVNVRMGEVVMFISRGQAFAFNFDGPRPQSFDLSRVAPPGMIDHKVVAYVAPTDTNQSHG
jgi:hypothetical protein